MTSAETSAETSAWREGGGRPPARERNVADAERAASALVGLGLVLWGLRKRGAGGLGAAAAGGTLLERGLTGHCRVYAMLGTGTGSQTRSPVASVPHGQGIKVERTVTVRRPASELYEFWRDFRNLPRVMGHLEEVEPLGGARSRWVARAPLGGRVSWEAEIWNERPGELIAWRSLEGSEIDNAGSVRFRELPAERGTEVRVVLEYRPPLGKVGAAVARLLGENPDQQVLEDLRRFKQLMEAGEVATTRGQPSARDEASPPTRRGATATSGSEYPLDPGIFEPAEGRRRRRRSRDPVQEASEESFPASDPPGWAGGEEEPRV